MSEAYAEIVFHYLYPPTVSVCRALDLPAHWCRGFHAAFDLYFPKGESPKNVSDVTLPVLRSRMLMLGG